jgi:hypothetical protein
MKHIKSTLVVLLACCLHLVSCARAADLSSWAIGRPALLIELPADPSTTNFSWSERGLYTFGPDNWVSEVDGLRIEMARQYTAKSPDELLKDIGEKMGPRPSKTFPATVSGRACATYDDGKRIALVVGRASEASGAPSWIVLLHYKDQAARGLAMQVLQSIRFEQYDKLQWSLRSFGRTSFMAELPYELTPQSSLRKTVENPGIARYEVDFNGMSLTVMTQRLQQQEGYSSKWDPERTIQEAIEGRRSMPGVTNLKSERYKFKLGKQDVERLILTFKQGHREYRQVKLYAFDGQVSLMAEINTDNQRTDHREIEKRIMGTVRYSNAIIYGWHPQAVGDGGLFLDLPKPMEKISSQGGINVYSCYTGPMEVTVREVMDSGNAGRNIAQLADFTSIALQSSKDIKNFKSEISSRFVDGLYAKVIKSTHQRLSFTNYQDVLVISGPDRQWIVYAIAAENEKDYVSHIIDDARVKLPAQATFRQYAGSAGFSFLYGDKKLETNVKENTNEDTKRETTASFTYPDGAGIVYEMELKQDSPLKSQDDYRMPINEFVRGIGGVVKFKEVTPLDVVNGSGYRFATDVTLNGNTMPGDFALFSQGKYIWMLAIIGDDQQPGARAARDLAFNSLRRD